MRDIKISDDAQRFWDKVFCLSLENAMDDADTSNNPVDLLNAARSMADDALGERTESLKQRCNEKLKCLKGDAQELKQTLEADNDNRCQAETQWTWQDVCRALMIPAEEFDCKPSTASEARILQRNWGMEHE